MVNPERNKRQHLSGVLARNEVERDYAYNRALFMRVAQGWYQFNPQLSVRRRQGEEEIWQPVYAALNLPLISEFARHDEFSTNSIRSQIEGYCAMANMPKPAIPVSLEKWWAQKEAKRREIERVRREIEARKKLP